VALIIVAPASAASTAASKPLPTTTRAAPGTVRLGLRFIDLQSASAKLRSVQSSNRLIGFARIGHFHKPESSRASSFAIGYNADFLDRSVRFENRSQLRLGGAVGQVADVKVLHCISSLNKSSYFYCFAAAAGLACEVIFCSISRLRFRFAAFCFRTRLNLALSPFTLDMIHSCYSGWF
jgi:hypothetical protein